MHFEAELIILDEPTVALSLKEVRKVLNFVHQDQGGRQGLYLHLPRHPGRVRNIGSLRHHGSRGNRGEHCQERYQPESVG